MLWNFVCQRKSLQKRPLISIGCVARREIDFVKFNIYSIFIQRLEARNFLSKLSMFIGIPRVLTVFILNSESAQVISFYFIHFFLFFKKASSHWKYEPSSIHRRWFSTRQQSIMSIFSIGVTVHSIQLRTILHSDANHNGGGDGCDDGNI